MFTVGMITEQVSGKSDLKPPTHTPETSAMTKKLNY